MNARCRASVEVFRAAVLVAEQERCTALVVLGDLFDSDRPEPQLVGDVLAILKARSMRKILIVGNHDQTSDEEGDHALAALATEATTIGAAHLLHLDDSTELVLVPHGADAPASERIARALRALPARAPRCTARLLGFHAGIADEKTAFFLKGSRGSIEASAVQRLMTEHAVDYAFAGDWHDRREWPGVLQIGALCPTGWDNPGFDGYGGVAIWDGASRSVRVVNVPGPRFIRVDSDAALRELLKDPRLAEEPHPLDEFSYYVSAHVTRAEASAASRVLAAAQKRGTVTAFEVLTTGAEDARELAHKAAGIARSATTLDEALANFVGSAPLELPDGVTSADVLAKCREYLR